MAQPGTEDLGLEFRTHPRPVDPDRMKDSAATVLAVGVPGDRAYVLEFRDDDATAFGQVGAHGEEDWCTGLFVGPDTVDLTMDEADPDWRRTPPTGASTPSSPRSASSGTTSTRRSPAMRPSPGALSANRSWPDSTHAGPVCPACGPCAPDEPGHRGAPRSPPRCKITPMSTDPVPVFTRARPGEDPDDDEDD